MHHNEAVSFSVVTLARQHCSTVDGSEHVDARKCYLPDTADAMRSCDAANLSIAHCERVHLRQQNHPEGRP